VRGVRKLATNYQRAVEIVSEDIASIVDRLGVTVDLLEGRSFLITGAAGMLARYIAATVAWCNRQRFSAPCADDLLRQPEWSRGLTFIEHDARRSVSSLVRADYVVLAATLGSPEHYLREPIETMELNGSGLGEWLHLAHRLQSSGVLYLSSGEIYGTPDVVPTPESYVGRVDPVSPRAVYAESKRYGEALCLAFHRALGLPVKIVRPFQVFGPGLRSRDGRAFGSFISSAALGQPITLQSAGTARRTFLYLADATVAFFKVLLEGSPGSIYNVGSPYPELTILELAQRVAGMAGDCSVRVSGRDSKAGRGSPARTCPDISKLRADFNFELHFSVDDMIARTLEWVRCNGQPH
jgi:UDP-glucuronate decarboxylase